MNNRNNISWTDQVTLYHLGKRIGRMLQANDIADPGSRPYPDPFDSSEFKEAQYMYALALNPAEQQAIYMELQEGIRQYYIMATWEVHLLLTIDNNDIIA